MQLTNNEIVDYINQIDKDAKAINRNLLNISWYMRGLSLSEIFSMSNDDIKIINEILDEKMELSKKLKQYIS